MIIDLTVRPGVELTEVTGGSDTLVRGFDHLVPGDHLVLLTDRDPRDEWQALHDRRPRLFTWNLLQRGPDVWQVWVGKIDPASIHP